MPATFIASNTSYVPGVSSSTLHVGSIRVGDIICVNVGAFGLGFPVWIISDNLGNGSALDGFGNPCYAKGAVQYGPGSFQKTAGLWAVSLIDGDLTVTIKTFASDLVTPFVLAQLNIVRVYRFPKVYAIDQGSVGIGSFAPGVGFNSGYGSADFNYADTLVVTSVMTATEASNFTSLTGDTLQNTVIQPNGGPFIPARTLLVLDRSSTGPGNGSVQIKYNDSQGSTSGNTSMAVMTFSIPLPDPIGLRLPGGRQYAARGGAGFDNNSSFTAGDQQADWNRPIWATFPYEVKVGDLVFVDVFIPQRNPTTIDIHDEYGPGFPILPPPFVNDYVQRIISAPTGSGSAALNGYMATYTCMVDYIPVQQHLGWLAGGVFQVRLNVSAAGSSAVYQATAIGITAMTVTGSPTNIAVAGLKSRTQVGQSELLATDIIPAVPAGTYMHAFAAYLPSNTQSSMSWAAMEDYVIRPESHWDFFQFPGQQTNAPRICGLAVMDKLAPSADDYDAHVTAVLSAFNASGGILLLAVTVPVGPPPPPGQPGSPCENVSLHPATDTQFELRRAYMELIPAPRIPVRGS